MSGKPKSPAPPPAAPRWLAAVAATPARDRAVVVLVAAFTISGVAVALTVDGHRVGTLGLVLTASAVYGAEMKFVGLGGPVWLMARLSRASLRWLLRNELLLQNAIDKAQPNAVPELQKRLDTLRDARTSRARASLDRRNVVRGVGGSLLVIAAVIIVAGFWPTRPTKAPTPRRSSRW